MLGREGCSLMFDFVDWWKPLEATVISSRHKAGWPERVAPCLLLYGDLGPAKLQGLELKTRASACLFSVEWIQLLFQNNNLVFGLCTRSVVQGRPF